MRGAARCGRRSWADDPVPTATSLIATDRVQTTKCRCGALVDSCLGPPRGTPWRPLPAACSSGEVGDWQGSTSEYWRSCWWGRRYGLGDGLATTPAGRPGLRPTWFNGMMSGGCSNGKRRPAEMIAGAALIVPRSDTEIPAGKK